MPVFSPAPSWFSYAAFLFRFTLVVSFLFQFYSTSAQCSAPIAIFPYQEDFESSDGGWVSGGLSNDWAWGTPGKPTINTAGSGSRCWITGGLTGSFYNLGQRSFVESPCFDFTTLPKPYIQFKIWWESEYQYDGANFQYSTDNGASWVNVGSTNLQNTCLNANWYNASSITNLSNLANPRQGWCGNAQSTMGSCQGGNGSMGWVTAKHCLNELAGAPNVLFRFTFGAGTTCNNFDGIAFDAIQIENAPPIVANFTNTCAGNFAFEFTDLSNNCPDAWTWDFGDPNSGVSNTSTLQNPTHTFSGPGLYQVSLQASSACSGADAYVFPIEVLGLQTSSTPPACVGGTNGVASVQLTSGGLQADFVWNTVPPQTGPTATHLSAGVYTVTATGSGICPLTVSVTVSDPAPSPSPQSGTIQALSDTTIALGNEVLLSGLVSDPGRMVSYIWEPPSYLDCATCLSTLASPVQTLTYTLTAVDSNGCSISDALEIRVLPGSVYIPNVFWPNSADQNQGFTVFAAEDVEQIELLQIYDRWGSLVFENQNFGVSDISTGWDGTINGKDAAPGVYFYVAKVKYINGLTGIYKGDVTVLR